MKRIELKKVSIVFLTMLLFLSIQIPAFAADTDTTVKIPVEQVFDSKNTDASDEFMYALLTDQSDAPMPDGSSNRRYVWNMKGNIATEITMNIRNAGQYHYKICQITEKKENYSYDERNYDITVEAFYNADNQLKVITVVENQDGEKVSGIKKFTNKSVVIISSVSGNTKEMVELVDRVHEKGAKVFSFIDNPGTTLTQPDKQDYLIVYPMNEQLKFYMVANYLMYKNGEFDDYDRYNKEMEANLADVLAQVEKDSDEWAYEYAKNKVAFWKEHKDLPHYFIGSGNQYGATYSYAMCYWEEQMWIRTKSISCQEFFHGMQEIIVEDTPVTLFMGEDEQRPLAERVAKFLPRVNANYTIIDTKEHELKGISPEFRGTISHLVMHGVNNRVDAYMELFLRHPLSIRRYYRQFDY